MPKFCKNCGEKLKFENALFCPNCGVKFQSSPLPADVQEPQNDFAQPTQKSWDIGYKILNRYEIIDIKKGGMGVVYIAHDLEWDQIFAIKTFQDKFLGDNDAIQRFMGEAETWVNLERHTNIVFANFVQKIDGKPLLFLEYIDDGDLDQRIGMLNIEESMDFAIQFCTGMEYAYQKLGVIHRDIKPANVMVQKNPAGRFGYSFKITDFGLVKSFEGKFQEDYGEVSTGWGTQRYMSPEQFPERIQEKFSFTGQITTRSDIYSFGVTLYLLLTGKPPYYDINQIFTLHPKSPKILNPKVPESLDRLIMKCIEKRPYARYHDFGELKQDLIRIYKDLTGENYTVVGKIEPFTEIDWSNKGVSLIALGKFWEAVEAYDRATALKPDYAEAWIIKVNLLTKLDRSKEALAAYDRATALKPDYADDAWIIKGISLAALDRHEEAMEAYDRAIVLKPEDAEVWINKGKLFVKLNRHEEAMEAYDRAIALKPEDAEVWINKGKLFVKLNRLEEAVAAYDRVIALYPDYAEAWINKGKLFAKLNRHEEAVAAYDHVITLLKTGGPLEKVGEAKKTLTYFGAIIGKRASLVALGCNEEAMAVYDRAVAQNAEDVETRINEENLLAERRPTEKVLARDGENEWGWEERFCTKLENAGEWINKANLLAKRRQYEGALAAYDRAIALNPEDVGVWIIKGNLLAKLNRHEEAVAAYDHEIALNPEDVGVWIIKGNLLAKLNRLEEAVEAYDRAIALNPEDVGVWIINKGNLLTKLNRLEEAVETYDRAIEINPKDAGAWFGKGNLLDALDRPKEAMVAYDQAIALNSFYTLALHERNHEKTGVDKNL